MAFFLRERGERRLAREFVCGKRGEEREERQSFAKSPYRPRQTIPPLHTRRGTSFHITPLVTSTSTTIIIIVIITTIITINNDGSTSQRRGAVRIAPRPRQRPPRRRLAVLPTRLVRAGLLLLQRLFVGALQLEEVFDLVRCGNMWCVSVVRRGRGRASRMYVCGGIGVGGGGGLCSSSSVCVAIICFCNGWMGGWGGGCVRVYVEFVIKITSRIQSS